MDRAEHGAKVYPGVGRQIQQVGSAAATFRLSWQPPHEPERQARYAAFLLRLCLGRSPCIRFWQLATGYRLMAALVEFSRPRSQVDCGRAGYIKVYVGFNQRINARLYKRETTPISKMANSSSNFRICLRSSKWAHLAILARLVVAHLRNHNMLWSARGNLEGCQRFSAVCHVFATFFRRLPSDLEGCQRLRLTVFAFGLCSGASAAGLRPSGATLNQIPPSGYFGLVVGRRMVKWPVPVTFSRDAGYKSTRSSPLPPTTV